MLSQKQTQYVQLGLATLIVLVTVVFSTGVPKLFLNLWFGSLWLWLAWRTGLSPVLMACLTFLALRSPLSSSLTNEWMLSVNIGLSVWGVSVYSQNKLLAPVVGLVWSLMVWVTPPLLLLVLLGFPKLCTMYGENRKWVSGPFMISILAFMGVQFFGSGLMALIDQAFVRETYQNLSEAFLSLLVQGQLWLFIPVIGVFELSQKQPDDPRFSWRSLALSGAVLSFLLVPAEPAFHMLYLLGIPISAIMLSRWSFTLPDLISRSIFWIGLALFSLPLFQAGLS